MKQIFYLVTVLIESRESYTDAHYLYASLDKAKAAMKRQIDEAQENFDFAGGDRVIDLPYCVEWRDYFGDQGYTVGIDEIELQD